MGLIESIDVQYVQGIDFALDAGFQQYNILLFPPVDTKKLAPVGREYLTKLDQAQNWPQIGINSRNRSLLLDKSPPK